MGRWRIWTRSRLIPISHIRPKNELWKESNRPAVYVLDASAMIAYLRAEPGGAVVQGCRAATSDICFGHAINLCEVHYDYLRAYNLHAAVLAHDNLIGDGLVIREDLDIAFWRDVGELKVRPGKLSLADCCGLTLARRESGTFLTSDHHELDRIAGTGVANIQFIR